jgi:hypothetical protein
MKFRSRTHLFAAPLIAILALAGCDDSTGPDDTINIVRLTVGTQTAYFDANGLRACCDGAGNPTLPTRITIPASGSAANQLTYATFARGNGTDIRLDPGTYEIRLVPGATSITWTPLPYPSGTNLPFSGNLRRTSAGVTPVQLSVVETSSGNTVFGPHTFQICTTAAGGGNTTDCAS